MSGAEPHLVINDEFHSYLARSWAPKTCRAVQLSGKKRQGDVLRSTVRVVWVNMTLKRMELNVIQHAVESFKL